MEIIRYIEYVKTSPFKDFIRSICLMRHVHIINWMEGFYFYLEEPKLLRLSPDRVFIHYDGFGYSKDEYSPYIRVDMDNGKFKPKKVKDIDPKSQDYSIKVDRIEPYEFGELRKFILNAIREVENAKEKYEKKKE